MVQQYKGEHRQNEIWIKEKNKEVFSWAVGSLKVDKIVFVVVVVVAHIYPPVTGQRQTLSCWTIRTLFITRTTSWLEESAPA